MKQTDTIGFRTLQSIAQAGKFNYWMFENICPYLHGNILEIGSGIGNISRFLVKKGYAVTLSDVDNFYLKKIKENFGSFSNVQSILQLDLQHSEFSSKYSELVEKFDTVFLLNVLEHLEYESYAIRNCKELLRKKGTLIILVPAYSFLFSTMDKALNHYRRYTTKRLKAILQDENLIIEKSFYFNAMGIPAWLWGKLMGYKSPPDSNMKFYDKLVPFGKVIDNIVFNKIGLSLIIVAKKTDPS